MLKIILITIVGIISGQTAMFTVDTNTMRDINTLQVTYIAPTLERDQFITHYERAVVLKMNTLLDEIVKGKHPQWRANNIVDHVKSYVKMNKTRGVEIERLNKSMEAYLEQTK